MLIGLNSTSSPNASQVATEHIYDVTLQNFEIKIMAESMKRPVIIEFWAPWCNPCKQLMPILESVITKLKGKIAMAKVNIDVVPELAQAFRVQSVPMVVALFMGQPVTGFAGIRPQTDIENLCTQLLALQDKNTHSHFDIPALLGTAKEFRDAGDLKAAQQIYEEILAEDHENIDAYVGALRVLIAEGNFVKATEALENAPPSVIKHAEFQAVKTALELAKNAPAYNGKLEELAEAVSKKPMDHAARFKFAEALYAQNMKERAVDELISIIRIDRTWNDGQAREQLLKYFESWGFGDPASISGRRKLSTLLFS